MADWTTPATWVAGQVVSDDDMNEQVRDNLSYLKDRTVAAREYNSGFEAISTSQTVMASVELEIPTDWNTWDVEVWWQLAVADDSGMNTGASTICTVEIEVDGSEIGELIHEVTDSSNQDNDSMAGCAFGEDLTATGTIDVDFFARRAGAPALQASRRTLIARAWRTS